MTKLLSGSETFGLKQIEMQALDLAGVDLAEHLVGVDAGAGDVLLVDAPDAGDVLAVLGVGDVAPAGKLIALLPVLAAALAVGLADDRAVAALGLADAAGREHEVDRAERVLHAVGVVLDAARVEEEAGLGRAPPLGRLADRALGHAGDFRGLRERPLLAVLGDLRRSRRCAASMNSRSIQPFSIMRLQHAGEQRRVAARA